MTVDAREDQSEKYAKSFSTRPSFVRRLNSVGTSLEPTAFMNPCLAPSNFRGQRLTNCCEESSRWQTVLLRCGRFFSGWRSSPLFKRSIRCASSSPLQLLHTCGLSKTIGPGQSERVER